MHLHGVVINNAPETTQSFLSLHTPLGVEAKVENECLEQEAGMPTSTPQSSLKTEP